MPFVIRFFIALLFPTLILSNISIAQEETTFVCSYTAGIINEKAICDLVGFQTRPAAQKAVELIVSRSGLKQNFYVMECPNIDNCFAAARNGERLIVYDASFMRRVNSMTQTDWGAMSILAHEIGHHLQGHTIKKGYEAAQTMYPNLEEALDKTEEKEIVNEPVIQITKIDPRPTPVEKEIIKVRTGCIEGNCRQGFGVAINRRTYERYEGNWKNGDRTGHGIEFYSDGKNKYEGDFERSEYVGFGSFYFQDGRKYVGEFKQGVMHDDKAIFYYRNGDRLFVRYVNGKKEGKARIVYYGGVEGTIYFENDIEH